MRTIANLGHSFAIQKNFQGWPLIYFQCSKQLCIKGNFLMALLYQRNVIFPLLSLRHSKPTLRDISRAYSLHVFIWPTSDSEFLQVSYFKFRFNRREGLFNYCSYFNHQQCCPTLQIYLLLTLNEWNLTGIRCQNLEVRI